MHPESMVADEGGRRSCFLVEPVNSNSGVECSYFTFSAVNPKHMLEEEEEKKEKKETVVCVRAM